MSGGWRRGLLFLAACLLLLGGARPASAADPAPDTLRIAYPGLPDYLDPALTYTSEGWMAMYNVYVPLLTYRHASGNAGSEVVPGLARSMPKIGKGGKTYTLFLRPGLRYSNGAPVRASDFEYAIKRTLRLWSGGSSLYYDIVGARRYQRTKRGGIPGILTDNRTGKIVIHLRRPRGTFLDTLALFFAAPVPATTPMRDRTFRPPAATGPYVIGRPDFEGWTFRRNPAWEAGNGALLPQLPGGHVERIEVRTMRGVAALRATLSGEVDWMAGLPPADRYQQLRRKYGGTRFRSEPTLSVYYFWMNTTKPPFDDLRVRRAVNHAIDPRVMRSIYGGLIEPTQQVLPPGMPGYRRLSLYPFDLARARRLIAAADPADREVTVWADTEEPNTKAAAYYAAQLRKLGFRARLKVAPFFNYFTAIGNRSTPNLDTGWSNWFADYAHPDDFFRPVLLGDSVQPTNNNNAALFDVPAINARIEKLGVRPLGPARERGYAALDRSVMKLAPWVPYGNLTVPTIVSRRVDLGSVVLSPLIGADLTSFRFD